MELNGDRVVACRVANGAQGFVESSEYARDTFASGKTAQAMVAVANGLIVDGNLLSAVRDDLGNFTRRFGSSETASEGGFCGWFPGTLNFRRIS